jgi:hypothetical protein
MAKSQKHIDGAFILAEMQELADDGWCVVLKRLPAELGWILQGSRSEYDAPCEDEVIGKGKWCCEATCMRHLRDAPYRHSQMSIHESPVAAVNNVSVECRKETARATKGLWRASVAEPALPETTHPPVSAAAGKAEVGRSAGA